MTEPDVTLTDYGLVLECGLLAALLCRRGDPPRPLRRWFALFFAATAVASLAGATVHGFFLDTATVGARVLWPAALVAIGGAALAAWGIGAHLQFSEAAARWIARGAAFEFVAYATAVVAGAQTFAIAVFNYLPAALFLLVVLALAYRRDRERAALLGAAGMLLTFLAAGVQMARVPLHARYFTHNAFYHLIQGVALLLLFGSARSITRRRPC